jgi:uncharacterized protein YhaN
MPPVGRQIDLRSLLRSVGSLPKITEQIYLATSLALAEVMAKARDRQLFVVDDALTAADPNRLRRFVGILEGLSRERLQVVVTTADPLRYLGIAGAKHIDLAKALLSDLAA